MTPPKSITLNYTSDGASEELTYTLTKRIQKLNIDPKEESKDINLEYKDEVLQSTSAIVVPSNCVHNEARNPKNEEESKPEEPEAVKEKPAAVYILNAEEWEGLRCDLEEQKITYTSAKRKQDTIEIKVADKKNHLKLVGHLLEKRIEHKTFLTRNIGELPDYMEELRRRKNKARRDCQKYPSIEFKRLANSLAYAYRGELANLRYNQYENQKKFYYEYQDRDSALYKALDAVDRIYNQTQLKNSTD